MNAKVGYCVYLYSSVAKAKIQANRLDHELGFHVANLTDEEVDAYVTAAAKIDQKLEKRIAKVENQ